MTLIWWLTEGGLSAGTSSSEFFHLKAPLPGAGGGENFDSEAQGPDAEGIFLCFCPITVVLWYLLKHRLWKRHWNNIKVSKGPWNSLFKPKFEIWRGKCNMVGENNLCLLALNLFYSCNTVHDWTTETAQNGYCKTLASHAWFLPFCTLFFNTIRMLLPKAAPTNSAVHVCLRL